MQTRLATLKVPGRELGEVAQLAEHAAENRGVGSSILPLATSATPRATARPPGEPTRLRAGTVDQVQVERADVVVPQVKAVVVDGSDTDAIDCPVQLGQGL